jgi:hypothetical protein
MMRQLLYVASVLATLALSRAIAESPPSVFAAAPSAQTPIGRALLAPTLEKTQ